MFVTEGANGIAEWWWTQAGIAFASVCWGKKPNLSIFALMHVYFGGWITIEGQTVQKKSFSDY